MYVYRFIAQTYVVITISIIKVRPTYVLYAPLVIKINKKNNKNVGFRTIAILRFFPLLIERTDNNITFDVWVTSVMTKRIYILSYYMERSIFFIFNINNKRIIFPTIACYDYTIVIFYE